MQYTAVVAQNAQNREGETTLKVPKIIHREMVNEFQRFGFNSLSQYTEYILTNRQKVMENATASPAPPTATPQSDFNPNFGAIAIPPKPQDGVYISREVSDNIGELWHKHAKTEKALQEAQENLKKAFRVIEQLIEEAGEHSGSLLGGYDRDYYEAKAIEFLQKEGLNIQ